MAGPQFDELKLQVTLVDNATGQLKAIKQQLDELGGGQSASNVERLKRQTSEVDEALRKLIETVSKGPKAFLDLARNVTVAGVSLGTFGLALDKTLKGIDDLSKSLVGLMHFSKETGIDPATVKQFEKAYRDAGLSIQQARRDLEGFNSAQLDLSRGASTIRNEMMQGIQTDERAKALLNGIFNDMNRFGPNQVIEKWNRARHGLDEILDYYKKTGDEARGRWLEQRFREFLRSPGMIQIDQDIKPAADAFSKHLDKQIAAAHEYEKTTENIASNWKAIKDSMLTNVMDSGLIKGLQWLDDFMKRWRAYLEKPVSEADKRASGRRLNTAGGRSTPSGMDIEFNPFADRTPGTVPQYSPSTSTAPRSRVPTGRGGMTRFMGGEGATFGERFGGGIDMSSIPSIGELLKPDPNAAPYKYNPDDYAGTGWRGLPKSKNVTRATDEEQGAIDRGNAIMEDQNAGNKQLVTELRRLNALLSGEEDTKKYEGGLAGLPRWLGGGGRGPGPGGGRDGRGPSTGPTPPPGSTPPPGGTGPSPYVEPGTGTPGFGPNPVSIPGPGGIPGMVGAQSGPAPGSAAGDPTDRWRYYDPSGVSGAPGGPSGPAQYGPSRTTTPGGSPPAGSSGTPGVTPDSSLVKYVADVEKFNPNAFWDINQYSIGYGTSARGRTSITEADARKEMIDQLQSHYADINKQFPNAPEGVKQALTSLTYNAGDKWRTGPLVNDDGSPTLRGLLEKGDYAAARTKFLEYSKAGGKILPGLAQRRRDELKQFWDNDKLKPGILNAPSAPPSGDIGPYGVTLPDQQNRPGRYTGTLTIGDQTFNYVTGGADPGGRSRGSSAPYGSFPIDLTSPYGGKGSSSIGAVATVGGNPEGGGKIYDPKYPNQPREGIQIHGASGATLDQMNTHGCFGIPKVGGEWERAKAAILEMARKNPGGLTLVVGRDGRASIVPRSAVGTVTQNYTPATVPPVSAPPAGPSATLAALQKMTAKEAMEYTKRLNAMTPEQREAEMAKIRNESAASTAAPVALVSPTGTMPPSTGPAPSTTTSVGTRTVQPTGTTWTSPEAERRASEQKSTADALKALEEKSQKSGEVSRVDMNEARQRLDRMLAPKKVEGTGNIAVKIAKSVKSVASKLSLKSVRMPRAEQGEKTQSGPAAPPAATGENHSPDLDS